ncbi:MAG: dihydroorotase [Candidatus Kaiserbacteria bacterium]|nr:dihydroorotase [Candidatus Kaiserbacteria bacterium]
MQIWKRDDQGRIMWFRMRMPIEGHFHARDKSSGILQITVPTLSEEFHAAVFMPNLDPPITTIEDARNYRKDIMEFSRTNFIPLMTMYLTDEINSSEVAAALIRKDIMGVKFYPPGLTTNSDRGVKDVSALWTRLTEPYRVLWQLANKGGIFFIHAAAGVDANGIELDPYDQEPYFIENILPRIRDAHPTLQISIEHLSTITGVEYMRKHGGEFLGCSMTVHHSTLDRRDLFRRGYNTHVGWMPILQSSEHRKELHEFMTEGHDFVWLGTDSAAHPKRDKEAGCCKSGVLMTHALERYAKLFDSLGRLDERFERFSSTNFAKYIGIDPSNKMVELVRKPWQPAHRYVAMGTEGPDDIVSFDEGGTLSWQRV